MVHEFQVQLARNIIQLAIRILLGHPVGHESLGVGARKLAAEAIGIDSHIDTVQRVLVMGEDLGKRWDVGHVGIPRLREGRTHAPFFALPSPNILEDSTGAWRAHSSSCSRPTSSPVPLLASVTPSV
jgi:hypothetical protein